MAVMTLCFFSFLTGCLIGATMSLKGEVFKFAGDVAALLPAPVRKIVGAVARSSPARAAADALVGLFLGMVCVMFTATFFNVVASRACDGDCSLAGILSEISDYSETLSLILLAPASALFFLRAAGCSSEVLAASSRRDINAASLLCLCMCSMDFLLMMLMIVKSDRSRRISKSSLLLLSLKASGRRHTWRLRLQGFSLESSLGFFGCVDVHRFLTL